jgi:hypothetical protein
MLSLLAECSARQALAALKAVERLNPENISAVVR